MKVYEVIGIALVTAAVSFLGGYSVHTYQQMEVSVTSSNMQKAEKSCASDAGLIRLVPMISEEAVAYEAFCVGGGKFSWKEAVAKPRSGTPFEKPEWQWYNLFDGH